jgi:hypothetical protein
MLVLKSTTPFQGLPELETESPLNLVDMDVQSRAHSAAQVAARWHLARLLLVNPNPPLAKSAP